MKRYTTPEIEIKSFDVETVVTASVIFTAGTEEGQKQYVETVSYATIFGLDD